jgi:hypothetical protein
MFFAKKKGGVTADVPKDFVDDHGEFVEKGLAIGAAAFVPVKILFDIDTLQKQGATVTMQLGTLTTQVGTLTTQVATLTTQMGNVLATMQRIEASAKCGPE